MTDSGEKAGVEIDSHKCHGRCGLKKSRQAMGDGGRTELGKWEKKDGGRTGLAWDWVGKVKWAGGERWCCVDGY